MSGFDAWPALRCAFDAIYERGFDKPAQIGYVEENVAATGLTLPRELVARIEAEADA